MLYISIYVVTKLIYAVWYGYIRICNVAMIQIIQWKINATHSQLHTSTHCLSHLPTLPLASPHTASRISPHCLSHLSTLSLANLYTGSRISTLCLLHLYTLPLASLHPYILSLAYLQCHAITLRCCFFRYNIAANLFFISGTKQVRWGLNNVISVVLKRSNYLCKIFDVAVVVLINRS